MKQRHLIPAASWRGNYLHPWPRVSMHSYFGIRSTTSHQFVHPMTIRNMVVDDDSTQVSSLSLPSTVSTATAESSITPPPAIQQPRVSPPRTVHLVPDPAPYAQLCFDPQQNILRTLLVGKPRALSKYTPVLDESPDLIGVISSQSSSVDSSTGWSSDPSSSSSCSSSWHCCSPQEIVWLDRAWLYDEGSDYSDTHRALLHDSESSADENDTSSTGCGKMFLRSVSLCRPKPHHRMPPSGSYTYSPKKLELKRFSLGKHYRYMTLVE